MGRLRSHNVYELKGEEKKDSYNLASAKLRFVSVMATKEILLYISKCFKVELEHA